MSILRLPPSIVFICNLKQGREKFIFSLYLRYFSCIADVMVLNDIINQAASRGTSFNSRRRSSRKISMLLSGSNPGDYEEEGPQLKERLTDAMYKAIDIFCVWDCCMPYIKVRIFS